MEYSEQLIKGKHIKFKFYKQTKNITGINGSKRHEKYTFPLRLKRDWMIMPCRFPHNISR